MFFVKEPRVINLNSLAQANRKSTRKREKDGSSE